MRVSREDVETYKRVLRRAEGIAKERLDAMGLNYEGYFSVEPPIFEGGSVFVVVQHQSEEYEGTDVELYSTEISMTEEDFCG